MSPKSRAFVSLSILIVVGLAGLILHGRTVQVDLEEPALALSGERSVTLAVDWAGDVYPSERPDCGVWRASFNCELRRGGSPPGEGVVMSRTLPISATAAIGTPGTGQWGTESVLTWSLDGLSVGWYETFVRLEITDGEETLYGYLAGDDRQDGQNFHIVDRFHVDQACFVPLRFSASQ